MNRLLSLFALVNATALLASTAFADPVTYKIDSTHSSVIFKVSHLNTSNSYGRFNDINGTITIDAEDPARNSLDVTIKADTIDTANAKRDEHLRGTDFFSTKEYPEITLKSDKITKVDDNNYAVEGKLTLRGKTQPVKFTITKTGSGKHPRSGQELIGGETEFTIKRSDFGMNYMPQALGEEVKVIVSVEAAKE